MTGKRDTIEFDYYINGIYQVSGNRASICSQLGITRQALKSRIHNTKKGKTPVKHILVEKEK